MNLLDLIPENGTPLAQEHFQNLQKNGIADGEIPFLRKEGTLRYWNVKAVKLSDNQFLGFVNDITDRIMANQSHKNPKKGFTWQWKVPMKEDKQKALDAGCNAYLTKPLKKSTIFMALNELLF